MSAKELAPFIVFVGVAFVVVTGAVGAYVWSSLRGDERDRKRASWIAAAVWTLVAVMATLLLAIPVLDDLRIPGAPFREALLGTIIVGAICLCLWVMAVNARSTRCGKPSPDKFSSRKLAFAESGIAQQR